MNSGRVFVTLTLWFSFNSLVGAQCLFVNTNSDPNTVAAFSVNPDGSLVAAAGSPFATGGSGLFNAAVGSTGLSVDDARLYVSNPSSDSVSGFDVAMDCTLSAVPGSPFAAGNRALALEPDPAGNFLYVANFLGNNISVFGINGDGSLTEILGSPVTTPDTPFDIVFDPAGGRFFVSHDFPSSVGAYDQAMDGTFTPVAGSPFAAGGFEHGLTLNPSATRLYVADFGPDTISGYSVGAGGVLTPLGNSPYAIGIEPIELLINGNVLYATNDNADNIGGFAIDGSGDLTALPGSPFAADSVGPAGLAQDPDGNFLFVANGGFGGNPDVSVYSVAGDGSIAPIAGSPFATGGTGDATGIVFFSALDVDLALNQSESIDPVVAGPTSGNLTYVVTLTNNGSGEATGISVSETLALPAGVTIDSITPSAGSFVGTTWTLASLASSASATLTVVLSVGSATAPGIAVIDSTAMVTALNEVDIDLGNNSVTDSTSVISPADLTATKSVAGDFFVGGTILYTITLSNAGAAAQADNPGDEFIDVLPTELSLVASSVVSGGGLAIANVDTNTVTWNGQIASGSAIIIEVTAFINASAMPNQAIANQGQVFFDADGNGSNESQRATDDPSQGGAVDPTIFGVGLPPVIPTLTPLGLATLLILLLWFAARQQTRQRAAE